MTGQGKTGKMIVEEDWEPSSDPEYDPENEEGLERDDIEEGESGSNPETQDRRVAFTETTEPPKQEVSPEKPKRRIRTSTSSIKATEKRNSPSPDIKSTEPVEIPKPNRKKTSQKTKQNTSPTFLDIIHNKEAFKTFAEKARGPREIGRPTANQRY